MARYTYQPFPYVMPKEAGTSAHAETPVLIVGADQLDLPLLLILPFTVSNPSSSMTTMSSRLVHARSAGLNERWRFLIASASVTAWSQKA
jgi:hypothetical protein